MVFFDGSHLLCKAAVLFGWLGIITTTSEKASFWYDTWSSYGPLIKRLGVEGPRELRIPIDSTVAQVCDANGWRLPPSRSQNRSDLQNHLLTVPLPSTVAENDYYSWVIHDKQFQSFPTAKTWEALRPSKAHKNWASSVWFKGATPKHSFTMWVAQLSRLPTRTRLASWGLQIPVSCCLCGRFNETQDHLLLTCVYSEQVWDLVLTRLRLSPCVFYTWDSLLAWTRMKTEFAPPILRKLAAQSVVYNIWKQRNKILHNQLHVTPEELFNGIDKELRNTILARRSRKQFRDLMALWIR
ncbi:PREDICTED: uncharacterized protein LOC104714907 [Camelina sativa]|uniref:Uncharacterized protein LOC104714907 n=1 Tax=Camelina sativa TaxID=90675 RepID=A0ABM1QF45_CAMSA|nr:PREDICTED: uncharacterized protein LOC104714907 [Camelina sativa]